MARWDLNIPDAIEGRVAEAFAAAYGYSEVKRGNETNPETKVQFAKKQIKQYVLEVVRAHEANDASEKARQKAADKADAEVQL